MHYKIAQTDLRGPIGEQLSLVVAKVAKDLGKKFRANIKGNPQVRRIINSRIAAENELYNRQQHDFADLMNQKKKKAEAMRAVKEAQNQVKEIMRKKKQQERILAAATAARAYTPAMLGDDKPNGY